MDGRIILYAVVAAAFALGGVLIVHDNSPGAVALVKSTPNHERTYRAEALLDEAVQRLDNAVNATDVNPMVVYGTALDVAHTASYALQRGVSRPTVNYRLALAVEDVVYAASIGADCGCVDVLSALRH